jgi:hypothetical protein
MKKQILSIALIALSAELAGAAGVDYGKLTIDNVPSIKAIVSAAAQASTSGKVDTQAELRRIHLSHLLPTVELSYGKDSRPQYEYGYNTLTSSYDYPNYTSGGVPSDAKDYIRTQEDWYNKGTSSTYAPKWYVDVEWELGKLVTDREEVYLYYVNARNSYYRTGTVENTVDVYLNLISLLREKKQAGSDPSLLADLTASAAELDFLTGNFLGQFIRNLSDIPETEAVADASVPSSGRQSVSKKPANDETSSGTASTLFDLMEDEDE